MYAAIYLYDKFYWYPVWDDTPHPTSIAPGPLETGIFSVTLDENRPIGKYTFYAAITEHQTINILDLDSVVITIN
jgi:hypothetical protein